jgi:dipeptidyl aminopeptidase/acylaminoacyl peptidase
LTRFDRHTGTPRWSPDSRQIVFDSLVSGNWDIWVADAEGGTARQLTQDPAEDGTPFWSRDGDRIYFHSNRSGNVQIWKMRVDGQEPSQVTTGGGYYAEESWDGRTLYYAKSHADTEIWQTPVSVAGPEKRLLTGPLRLWCDWAVGRSGIYYAAIEHPSRFQGTYEIQGAYEVHVHDFATRESRLLFRRDGSYFHITLAVSPAEDWLLFGEAPLGEAELMLVENFR